MTANGEEMTEWVPGSRRQAAAAPWEPWAFYAMFVAFCADLWLMYEAYHTHAALWRAGVGLVSALVVLEGVSVAVNYRDAAFKIAGPDPGKWRTMRNSPYPSSPRANRMWAAILIVLAISCAARGIAP